MGQTKKKNSKDIYVDFKSGQELIFHIEGGTYIVRIFFSALA